MLHWAAPSHESRRLSLDTWLLTPPPSKSALKCIPCSHCAIEWWKHLSVRGKSRCSLKSYFKCALTKCFRNFRRCFYSAGLKLTELQVVRIYIRIFDIFREYQSNLSPWPVWFNYCTPAARRARHWTLQRTVFYPPHASIMTRTAWIILALWTL